MTVVPQPLLIHVLWTGGLDSSYRMVQLSRQAVHVQPYYLKDNRRSEQRELNSIAEITKDIQEHSDTVGLILRLITHHVDDIAPDREITRAYRRLRRAMDIGSQYDWLARFAKSVDGLELCVEKADSSKALNCILKYGALKVQDGVGTGAYHVIDTDRSSPDLVRVFGGFRFPVIDKKKSEMIEDFKRLGLEQSMHKTWFCFTPINGESCGVCNPCKSAIQEGLTFRFTETALERYRNPPRVSLLNRTAQGILSKLRVLDAIEDFWADRKRRKRRMKQGG